MNRNFSAICVLMFFCAVLIAFFGSFGLRYSSVPFAESDGQKVVYLTFDDGPSDRVTPKILDVLKEENVKATFFIVGRNALLRQDILRREVDEGHSVGVHSYTHDYKQIYSSPKNLAADIDKCNDLIEAVTGARATLYRFPGGSYDLSSELKEVAAQKGLEYVDWNASFCDCEIPHATPDELYKAAISETNESDSIIMLAHDSTNKLTTVDALKKVIRHYKSEGYEFATLDSLHGNAARRLSTSAAPH